MKAKKTPLLIKMKQSSFANEYSSIASKPIDEQVYVSFLNRLIYALCKEFCLPLSKLIFYEDKGKG